MTEVTIKSGPNSQASGNLVQEHDDGRVTIEIDGWRLSGMPVPADVLDLQAKAAEQRRADLIEEQRSSMLSEEHHFAM